MAKLGIFLILSAETYPAYTAMFVKQLN